MNSKEPEISDAFSTRLHVRQERFLDALASAGGNVSQASRECGIGTNQHYRWLNRYASYRAAVQEIVRMLRCLRISETERRVREFHAKRMAEADAKLDHYRRYHRERMRRVRMDRQRRGLTTKGTVPIQR